MNWERFKNFLKGETGATAVEFGLVAAPLFAFLYAILSLALLFLSQEVLQSAVTQTGRLIMTGQVQNANMSAGQFQQQVCANAPIFNCSDIYVNVETFSSFSGMSMLDPLNEGVFDEDAMSYVPGGRGDIVLVQAFYQVPAFVGPVGFNLSNMDGNKRLIVAAAVFRNEPY